eukprot:TRINITY_DN1682_c0_g1_i1.p1 TRINITY_DN1682_c0_g1~~TRINITY_DN1682_c0_g1_i1.p1  ORF type:complete len:278 (-),score=61.85 TRINITY_DN1682_c0_g1_i1:788-1621(-)
MESGHDDIRQRICDYMQANPEHFAPFVFDMEYSKYIRDMRKDGTWGGHMELQAASMCFKVNILIHQLDAPRMQLECHTATNPRTIQLGYCDMQHYVSVRPADIPLFRASAVVEVPSAFQQPLAGAAPAAAAAPSLSGTTKVEVSHEEKIIIDVTGCRDIELIRQMMQDANYDYNQAMDYLIQCPDSWAMVDDVVFVEASLNEPRPRETVRETEISKKSDIDSKFGKKKLSNRQRQQQQKAEKEERKHQVKERVKEAQVVDVDSATDAVVQDFGTISI